MRADGKTAGGMWIYTGVYTEAGNMSMRRDASDPTGLGIHPNWGFSWPANRRVLYNRASADPSGKPWSERKKYMWWNGARWAGGDVPDEAPTVAPDKAVLQPEMFVEMGERLAKAKGIANGDWVEISSQRGAIKAKASVTKRLRPIMVDGKPCDVVGLPIHYGFIGFTKKSHPINTLT